MHMYTKSNWHWRTPEPLPCKHIYTVIIVQNAIDSIIYDIVRLREQSAKWGEPHWMATVKLSIYINC